jgi:hypothetical protein
MNGRRRTGERDLQFLLTRSTYYDILSLPRVASSWAPSKYLFKTFVKNCSGNTINGSLACTGNTPAPGDAGAVNAVSGTATGQCTPLATR